MSSNIKVQKICQQCGIGQHSIAYQDDWKYMVGV